MFTMRGGDERTVGIKMEVKSGRSRDEGIGTGKGVS
jgi:hypothetical protein